MRTAAITWSDLHSDIEELLGPGPESRWLVEEASGRRWGDWSTPPSTEEAARLAAMVDRRLAGEPLQYVLGRWNFRGVDLLVDARVLIPRPETEVVAEVALAEAARMGLGAGSVTDLGTGSGALALALATRLPDVEVWATDVSDEALSVAEANRAAAGPAGTRVRLSRGVWYEALPPALQGRLHLIVSNPPYVAEAELDSLPAEVRDHEPRQALVAGPAGTEDLVSLLEGAPRWLVPDGALVLELAPHQAGPVTDAAQATGAYSHVRVHPDLAGRARVLVARRGHPR